MSVTGGRRREDFIKYSFDFDGTDEFFSGSTTYTELDGQSKCTISAWIKVGTGTDTLSYLCAIPGGSLFTIGIRLQTSTSTLVWCYVNTAANNNRASTNIGTIKNDGLWHHLMVCLDLSLPNPTECQIFLDGNAQSMAGNFANTTLPAANDSLYIGNRDGINASHFGGNIDELAIWSGQDLRENINEIYNNGAPNYLNNLPSVPPPTNWFRMGELSSLNGTQWTMTDVNGGYTVLSESMDGNNRVEDTPQ